MSTPSALYHTRNRIVAVDIVRIMAAFGVMYEHLGFFVGSGTSEAGARLYTQHLSAIIPTVFANLSPLFLVLAGFFACRNITWKKAFNNAWWSFAPFILWNLICILYYALFTQHAWSGNAVTAFGVQHLFVEGITLFPHLDVTGVPTNSPLWFMRDLALLFLLSPFLARWARVVFPLYLIASFVPALAPHYVNYSEVVLAPSTICFFSLGCLLQTLSKEHQRKVLTFYSPCIIIAYVGIMAADALHFHLINNTPAFYTIKQVIALWVIYQAARWVEVRIPCATPFALKFAPVTFLTFAAHMIVFDALGKFCTSFYPRACHTDLLLLFPVVAFAFLSAFFFALKRYGRPLLHLVAHYKLRPDDMPASKPQTTTQGTTSLPC